MVVPLPAILCLLALLALCDARLKYSRPYRPRPSGTHHRNAPRDANTGGACSSSTETVITAPQANIFLGLTNQEVADVTALLHDQKSLNLTKAPNATDWDNVLLLVELLQPNKSDALAFLDAGAAAPTRYARARIQFGATLKPYLQEFSVGPLPVKKGQTQVEPLNYIFNKGVGRIDQSLIDETALEAYNIKIGGQIADITKELLGTVITGSQNDTIFIASNDAPMHKNGRVSLWQSVIGLHTGLFVDEDLLPTALQFKVDITGRDPSKWSVQGWFYNGVFYKTVGDLRRAIKSPGFVKAGLNVDGAWASTDQAGTVPPRDKLYPPLSIQPDGPRFGVDPDQKYVEWMDFSFYIAFNRDTGMSLRDVRYKGDRIIYELGLQEALAHYASSDPFQSTTAYLDSYYGMGLLTFELVRGFDCPDHATYLNATFNFKESTHTHPDALCLFEMDAQVPIQRHIVPYYVSSTKTVAFVLRSISTVGNYDYIFDYEFHMDGSIFVTVRASGYIQAGFWMNNPDYGFHIHDNLSGSMHDHVINYKLDLDVLGTSNSLMRTAVVPTTETYPWSDEPRNTMKLQRSFVESESEGKINWAPNAGDTYTVVNKQQKNKYGEYRGWKVMPMSKSMRLTVQHSSTLGESGYFADNDLFAVKRKDTEPRSAYPYNNLDYNNPVVNFNKFFDGESLDQEDIVLYFNLGMHHIPHTGDLPNTVTTTAVSTLGIMPQNYLLSDPSRETIHQVRVNISPNSTVADTDYFGAKQPTCDANLGSGQYISPLNTYTGEVIIPKYPFQANDQTVGPPGTGLV